MKMKIAKPPKRDDSLFTRFNLEWLHLVVKEEKKNDILKIYHQASYLKDK